MGLLPMKLNKQHWLLSRPIAHRGLHDEQAPENTLAAFQKAIDKGHPIELDIQILQDGAIVVFHDNDLCRLCETDIPLEFINLKDLRKFKVNKSDENIPTLEETLNFINNQVPVLIEIKNEKTSNNILHTETLKILKKYKGDYAIQSFNPFTVRYFLKHLPSTPVGLLSGSMADVEISFLKKMYLKNIIDSYIHRPAFIAYEWSHLSSISNTVMKKIFKMPFIAWTISNEEQKKSIKNKASNYIFENTIST